MNKRGLENKGLLTILRKREVIMTKINWDIKLLETVDEKFATSGTKGKMWKTEAGHFFRPYDAIKEFDENYPDGLCIDDYEWERLN